MGLDWEEANRREKTLTERELRPRPEWWWLPSNREGRCDECGNEHTMGDQIAFNGQVVRCMVCIEREGIQPGISRKFRKMQQSGQKAVTKRRAVRREIDAKRTPRGGWSRNQLAQWGVSWPPPKGWKRRLEEEGLPR